FAPRRHTRITWSAMVPAAAGARRERGRHRLLPGEHGQLRRLHRRPALADVVDAALARVPDSDCRSPGDVAPRPKHGRRTAGACHDRYRSRRGDDDGRAGPAVRLAAGTQHHRSGAYPRVDGAHETRPTRRGDEAMSFLDSLELEITGTAAEKKNRKVLLRLI